MGVLAAGLAVCWLLLVAASRQASQLNSTCCQTLPIAYNIYFLNLPDDVKWGEIKSNHAVLP